MPRFWDVFPLKNTLLIVVHVEDEAQAFRNVTIARNEGAHGVFLINHSIPAPKLGEHFLAIRKRYPRFWVGLNFLDLPPEEAVKAAEGLGAGGVWLDNAGIDEGASDPTYELRHLHRHRESRGGRTLLFGGVAFKYQRQVQDVERVARLSAPFLDVVTTSGDATGMAPTVEKIAAMQRGVSRQSALAIASGITPENVKEYMPLADCFLVATGVSHSHTELDPARVRLLAQTINLQR